MSTVADVIVIGAGLAGLKAATDIQKAGFSCLVLEARERVGGKTWSAPVMNGTGCVDLGAAWINDKQHCKMWEMVKEFGLETIVQNIQGNIALLDEDNKVHPFLYGADLPSSKFSKAVIDNIDKVKYAVQDACLKVDLRDPMPYEKLDQISLEEFVCKKLGGGNEAVQTVRIWVHAMLGLEAVDISALAFLDYCKSGVSLLNMRSDGKDGAQYLRIRQGTQSFARGLATRLTAGSVILSTPVISIDHIAGLVKIVAKDGRIYRAKKVVVTVPTPIYKDIEFNPPLSANKATYAANSKHGYYTKLIAVFDKPWWRDNGFCGLAQSYDSTRPFPIIRDTSSDNDGQYSLTCFASSVPGRKWSKLPAHIRRHEALKQIGDTFGSSEVASRPIEVFEQQWSLEPFSQGAPCPMPAIGMMANDIGSALRKPEGKLYFAGTETAYEWKGYMEGAVRSGERAAGEVIDSLNGVAKL